MMLHKKKIVYIGKCINISISDFLMLVSASAQKSDCNFYDNLATHKIC